MNGNFCGKERAGHCSGHPGHGLQESQHVFVEGNALNERFRKLHGAATASEFVIVETGFGTGLNFLATWNAWQQSKANNDLNRGNHRLVYIGIEKYPMTVKALGNCLAHYNPLPELSGALLRRYPDPISPHYTLEFDDAEVRLVLLFSDALDALDQLEQGPQSICKSMPGFSMDLRLPKTRICGVRQCSSAWQDIQAHTQAQRHLALQGWSGMDLPKTALAGKSARALATNGTCSAHTLRELHKQRLTCVCQTRLHDIMPAWRGRPHLKVNESPL